MDSISCEPNKDVSFSLSFISQSSRKKGEVQFSEFFLRLCPELPVEGPEESDALSL